MDAANPPAATALAVAPKDYVHDTVIYPGLYAPSGFDMMSILVRDGTCLFPTLPPFPLIAYIQCRGKNKERTKGRI